MYVVQLKLRWHPKLSPLYFDRNAGVGPIDELSVMARGFTTPMVLVVNTFKINDVSDEALAAFLRLPWRLIIELTDNSDDKSTLRSRCIALQGATSAIRHLSPSSDSVAAYPKGSVVWYELILPASVPAWFGPQMKIGAVAVKTQLNALLAPLTAPTFVLLFDRPTTLECNIAEKLYTMVKENPATSAPILIVLLIRQAYAI